MRCRLWACVLLALGLGGCGSAEHEDLKQWMTESSRDMKGNIPSLPELRPFPVVSYDASAKSDPFSAVRIEAERKGGRGANQPDFDRPREQLEAFPLETIKFIGLVNKTKSGIRHALVQVDGVVYQVGKGNYLGQNYGRIIEISDNEVIIKEVVQDPTGQTSDWVEREMTLQLIEGAKGKESRK